MIVITCIYDIVFDKRILINSLSKDDILTIIIGISLGIVAFTHHFH